MSENTPAAPVQGFQLGSPTYDRLKFVVQIILPALGVLYASLSQFWGFPYVQEVVGSITALALFFGVLLGLSSRNFSPPPTPSTPVGTFNVVELPDGKKSVTLDFDRDPESFIGNDNITFKTTKVEGDYEELRDENSP